jgi:hypothetical protein
MCDFIEVLADFWRAIEQVCPQRKAIFASFRCSRLHGIPAQMNVGFGNAVKEAYMTVF